MSPSRAAALAWLWPTARPEVFQSPSPPKPGLSRGFQAEPGPHITKNFPLLTRRRTTFSNPFTRITTNHFTRSMLASDSFPLAKIICSDHTTAHLYTQVQTSVSGRKTRRVFSQRPSYISTNSLLLRITCHYFGRILICALPMFYMFCFFCN